MNELKYQITQFIFLALLGFGAYWALTHLDNGISYSRDQIVERDTTPSTPIESPIINTIPDDEEIVENPDTSTTTVDEEETQTPSQSSGTLTATEKELVSALERLISDQIYMKVGSRGTRVGTVQKFLDYYFPDKTVSTDNDYGPGTKTLVEQFQAAEGLTADGQAGPNTYQKMIDVIKE
tara:strand:- start:98 stop:637 length:540 start_codon:yes stop_codon:yes gene_type:complete